MPLKNYSTKVSSERTISEIEKILATHGVTDIWKQYEGGLVTGLNFIVRTEFGNMPFKLPMKPQAIQQILKNQKNAGKIKTVTWKQINDLEQSHNIGWRIIKDWIDSQMALIEMEMVTIDQVFLPYMYDRKTEKTLYEKLQEKGFAGLLEDPKDEG